MPKHECLFEEQVAAYLSALELGDKREQDRIEARVGVRLGELRSSVARLEAIGVVRKGDGAARQPERLREFRILDRIGSGGMGIVYRAVQEPMERIVALKVLRPELAWFETTRQRFGREIEAIAAFGHPGIVKIHSVGESDGVPFYAMEMIHGCSLRDALEATRELSSEHRVRAVHARIGAAVFTGSWIDTVLRIMRQVAGAVGEVHRREMAHRDIKPSNIMLARDGRIVLVDFGLVRREGSETLTRTGGFLGSPNYAAPELLRDDRLRAGTRQDVYALGVVLYELLAAAHPFAGATTGEVRKRILHGSCSGKRQLRSMVPREVETVVAKAMDLDAERRYASGAEFAEDLDRLLTLRPVGARRVSWLVRARRYRRRRPTAVAAVAIALIGLVIVPLLAWSSIRRERDLAVRSSERARTMASVLVGFFENASPSENGGREVRASEVVLAGLAGLGPLRRTDPILYANLAVYLGVALRGVGDFAAAEKCLTDARSLLRATTDS